MVLCESATSAKVRLQDKSLHYLEVCGCILLLSG